MTDPTPARLLITGGAGFIGSALVREALRQGHEVHVLDALTYAGSRLNLAPDAGETPDALASVRLHVGDITDRALLRAILTELRPDRVIHLAAESHVDRSIDAPEAFITTNVVGTFRLLEACRAHIAAGRAPPHFRFHHVSTDEVYGSLGQVGAFTEESPYAPNSPYAASKASSDMLVRAWGETYGLPVVTSNCSNNYGPRQHPEKLIPAMILAAHAGRALPVYGQGLNVRDWLHVDDHARALLLIGQKGRLRQTYLVGGDTPLRNLDLVERLCALMDARFPDSPLVPHRQLIRFVTDRPGHDLRYAVDSAKLRKELGWRPQVTLQDGLARTLDWYLANPEWVTEARARGGTGARLGLGAPQPGTPS
jgi:dTDP-glucose 4,6-dehydratase